ncbi:BUD13 homolog isoform 2-T2 [Cariama cristata]
MAAQGLSKAEYLRRYLSGPAAAETAQLRRRRKKKPPGGAGTDGMRIVDDDVSWNSIAAVQEKEDEEDEGDMPVVAEFIDERPGEVKLMEEFRTNTKWKLLGDQNDDSPSLDISVPAKLTMRRQRHDCPDLSPPRRKHNGSPNLSLPRRKRHHSLDLSPPRRQRHDSLDLSPPRRQRHDSPDLSPKRVNSGMGKKGCKTTDKSQLGGVQGEQSQLRHGVSDKPVSRQKRQATPDLSPPRKKRYDSDSDSSLPRRRRVGSPQSGTKGASPATKKLRPLPSPQRCLRHNSDSPPPRRGTRNASDADRGLGRVRSDSPKRGPLKQNQSVSSDSDLSPPRRTLPARKDQHNSRSPPDLSPHRHCDAKGSPKKANMMLSGVKAGLVSADVLRREQQELRRHERSNKHLEEESRHSETVFRDKSGRRRDLAQERLEQRQKAEAKSERDEQYAKWGKGGGVGGMWLRAEFEPGTRRARVSHMSETLPQLLLPLLDVHWECCACGGSSGLWSILQAEEATVNDCLVLE